MQTVEPTTSSPNSTNAVLAAGWISVDDRPLFTKTELMEKKKRDVSLPKRFNSEDVKKRQEQANLTTGGNLTLWMENALNNAVKKQNVKSKQ